MRASIPLHVCLRDVGETDAHGHLVAALLHAAKVNDLAAVAGSELVQGGVRERTDCKGIAFPVKAVERARAGPEGGEMGVALLTPHMRFSVSAAVVTGHPFVPKVGFYPMAADCRRA